MTNSMTRFSYHCRHCDRPQYVAARDIIVGTGHVRVTCPHCGTPGIRPQEPLFLAMLREAGVPAPAPITGLEVAMFAATLEAPSWTLDHTELRDGT